MYIELYQTLTFYGNYFANLETINVLVYNKNKSILCIKQRLY